MYFCLFSPTIYSLGAFINVSDNTKLEKERDSILDKFIARNETIKKNSSRFNLEFDRTKMRGKRGRD